MTVERLEDWQFDISTDFLSILLQGSLECSVDCGISSKRSRVILTKLGPWRRLLECSSSLADHGVVFTAGALFLGDSHLAQATLRASIAGHCTHLAIFLMKLFLFAVWLVVFDTSTSHRYLLRPVLVRYCGHVLYKLQVRYQAKSRHFLVKSFYRDRLFLVSPKAKEGFYHVLEARI